MFFKEPALNWPNRLTILRILLVPVFIIALLYEYYKISFAIFCLASITDALDGFIARTYNQKTTLGTFLDPIADKLLLSSAFIVLATLGKIPVWLTILVISRDIIITSGSLVLYILNGQVCISPTILGKMTTFSQISTIVTAMLSQAAGYAPTHWLVVSVIFLCALSTVSSGLHYVYIGAHQFSHGLPEEQ